MEIFELNQEINFALGFVGTMVEALCEPGGFTQTPNQIPELYPQQRASGGRNTTLLVRTEVVWLAIHRVFMR
jgi:hypothetical protein